MRRMLIFLTILAIFLTACGAPPMEPERADNAGTTQAPTAESPAETVAPTTGEPEADEERAAEAPEYFLFTKRTNNITTDDGLTLLLESQAVPTFTSADPERSAWVNELLDGIERDYATNSENLRTYAEDFVELNGTEYFYSHSNYQQLAVCRHDSAVVSLICLSSLYAGGSHPNSVQTTYNLDIANRRLLSLEDILLESGAGELTNLVQAGVDEKFSAIDSGFGLFEDHTETIENTMNWGAMTPYWYLTDTGLVIFYNQYELGPYAAGIIKVEVPYADLTGILREEYFPAQPDGTPGDLYLTTAGEGRTISITIDPAGQTLSIGVEGQIHQVRLSEVVWLEDTPISQEVLFSAMTLSEGDVLQLTGGYTDDTRSFAIEFINGQGQQKTYYIHTDALTEEP